MLGYKRTHFNGFNMYRNYQEFRGFNKQGGVEDGEDQSRSVFSV